MKKHIYLLILSVFLFVSSVQAMPPSPPAIPFNTAAPGTMGLTTPFAAHNLKCTKTISSTPVTLTLPEISNGIIWVTTGASVIVLPTAGATFDGATVKFKSIVAVAYSIDNTAQVSVLYGTDLASGFKVTSSGVVDEEISFTWDNTASKWRTSDINGVFIDGGA